MTCTESQPTLPLFHAGALEPVEREAVEAHLLGCPSCLRSYFEAKRASEDVPLDEALPAPTVRERLRAEVIQLGSRGGLLPWRRTWMMGAVAAALALLAIALAHRPASPPSPSPSLLIDSDQAEASLSVL